MTVATFLLLVSAPGLFGGDGGGSGVVFYLVSTQHTAALSFSFSPPAQT